jgi:hypothetical protein
VDVQVAPEKTGTIVQPKSFRDFHIASVFDPNGGPTRRN